MKEKLTGYVKRHPMMWGLGLLMPPIFGLAAQLLISFYAKKAFELLPQRAEYRRILLLTGVVFLAILAAYGVRAFFLFLNEKFGILSDTAVKEGIFTKAVTKKYPLHEVRDAGDILVQYNQNAESLTKVITSDIYNISYSMIMGIGGICAVFYANWAMGFVALFLITAVICGNVYFGPHYKRLEEKKLEASEEFQSAAECLMQGKVTIRMAGMENRMAEYFSGKADTLAEVERAAVRLDLKKGLTMDWMIYAAATLILPLSCLLTAGGWMTIPNTVFIMQICGSLIWNTQSLGTSLIEWKKDKLAVERIGKSLEEPSEIQGDSNSVRETAVPMKWDQVKISYEEQVIQKQISLNLKKGELLAVVGESGCGKSSLLKLALGLIPITAGNVHVLGTEVTEESLYRLRDLIAYVPENAILMEESIRENLLYGKTSATDPELLNALREAGFSQVGAEMLELPAGTMGENFSAGERQRICLARAILKDAPIYLLDEPTSGLDEDTEQTVISALKKLKDNGKAVLMITHREAAVVEADRIVRIS